VAYNQSAHAFPVSW